MNMFCGRRTDGRHDSIAKTRVLMNLRVEKISCRKSPLCNWLCPLDIESSVCLWLPKTRDPWTVTAKYAKLHVCVTKLSLYTNCYRDQQLWSNYMVIWVVFIYRFTNMNSIPSGTCKCTHSWSCLFYCIKTKIYNIWHSITELQATNNAEIHRQCALHVYIYM